MSAEISDDFKRPIINIEKTWLNIKKMMKQTDVSVKDLQLTFNLGTPQAVYKKMNPGTKQCLPTVEELVYLSRLFDCPIEKILVIENGYVDDDFRRLYNKTSEIRVRGVLRTEEDPEDVWDEQWDKFVDFALKKNDSIYIKIFPDKKYIFKDEFNNPIQDEHGNIHYEDKITGNVYDINVDNSNLRIWYDDFLNNWNFKTLTWNDDFDYGHWESKAITIAKELLNIFPDNWKIIVQSPEGMKNSFFAFENGLIIDSLS